MAKRWAVPQGCYDVMNYKRKKPKYRGNKQYDIVWNYKKSFKLDYILKKEFKKIKQGIA